MSASSTSRRTWWLARFPDCSCSKPSQVLTRLRLDNISSCTSSLVCERGQWTFNGPDRSAVWTGSCHSGVDVLRKPQPAGLPTARLSWLARLFRGHQLVVSIAHLCGLVGDAGSKKAVAIVDAGRASEDASLGSCTSGQTIGRGVLGGVSLSSLYVLLTAMSQGCVHNLDLIAGTWYCSPHVKTLSPGSWLTSGEVQGHGDALDRSTDGSTIGSLRGRARISNNRLTCNVLMRNIIRISKKLVSKSSKSLNTTRYSAMGYTPLNDTSCLRYD